MSLNHSTNQNVLRSEKQTFVHEVCIFIQFIHIILTSLTDKKNKSGMKKIIECKIRDSLITVNFLSTYLKHGLSNEPVYT